MILGLHKYASNAHRLEKGRSGGSGGGGSASGVATAPLPEGVSVRRLGGTNAIYDFEQAGNSVSVQISDVLGEHVVDFSVNGRFSTNAGNSISSNEGASIARKVSAVMKHDASTRPDGFFYSTSAVTGDGLGQSRTAFYARAGFSFPSRAGATQYAVVKKGRLTPSNRNGEALTKKQVDSQNKRAREALRQAARDRKSNRSR